MINHKNGNMFDNDEHDCYVNTINCVGAMGAGIALEFKQRHTQMFTEYQELCRERQLAPGDCWIYKPADANVTLVGLAVKNHFKNRIRFSWARMAIRNFVNAIKLGQLSVQNVAFPRIGSKNGGRGKPILMFEDNWPTDSEKGYVETLEPFLLAELQKVSKVDFTIYKL